MYVKGVLLKIDFVFWRPLLELQKQTVSCVYVSHQRRTYTTVDEAALVH